MDGLVNQLIEEAKGVLEKKESFVWKDASKELPDLDKYKYALLITSRYPKDIMLCKSYQYVDSKKYWVPCNSYSGGLIKNSEVFYWMPFDFWTKFELPQALTE